MDNADEDDLYTATDWLLERQDTIERKLAARHLQPGGLVLYDLSSSYFEGKTCPLAALGDNRDGKKGKLQVNYGLLTDRRACPIAVSVFSGDTSDTTTFRLPLVCAQLRKLWIAARNRTLAREVGVRQFEQVALIKQPVVNKGADLPALQCRDPAEVLRAQFCV